MACLERAAASSALAAREVRAVGLEAVVVAEALAAAEGRAERAATACQAAEAVAVLSSTR